uniref:Uncharacterized protein n=1 Tax=Phlebotomus papatasi TaxID=29031 RepID=A0A1B0D0I5_PHLPP
MSTNCDKFNGNTIPTIFTDKMNEDAQSDPVEMELELRNLQSVINVTRENIDALNAKFANLQEPPPMYIKEYQELASKLHELRDKELEIMEKLQQQCEYATNTVTVEPPEPPDPDTETESNCSTLTKQPKFVLRAHLPNQQRTSVQVTPGIRLRDALSKALKRRNLTCEMCEVTTQLGSSQPIPWDTDISCIQAEEVYVKVLDKFPVMSQISHQFMRKTFFSLAFCECCRRLLFTGFYCNQCNFRFHQRCADKVPRLCNKIDMESYYQFLLEQNPDNCAGLLKTGGLVSYQSRHVHPRSLNQQDRSNSAPNVCINSVKTLSEHQKMLAQQARGALQSQSGQEHSQSTQASPTNTLKHMKRPRARR